ncbi:hypothetical protein BJV74DRAFT_460805 [Russula compacta]|nr:hypothetical protein BJV74DRAFT_460805 [Russula compacta]
MNDDHEVDWGNDEDDPRAYFDSLGTGHAIGDGETNDVEVEDAVSLGGDEEEEFAAYGAHSNEQNTFSADKFQTTVSKKDVRRRSASISVSSRKERSQVQPAPLPPSPQPEIRQPTPKLTHALPPKPVVSSSIRAPPSTTAASPMSLPRKERRSNGSTTKKGDEPSLSDKETRSSRTAGRDDRHRDSRAEESSWTRPSSDVTDSQAPHRDRTRSFNDKDARPSSRREDDCYRPAQRQAHYSSDEEGREPNPHRAQTRHDVRYRYDDRDRHHGYDSGEHTDRPVARSARYSPEESVDRSRTDYRESNGSDSRRAHPSDRGASPVRDDSSRRVLRRDDYPAYSSFDKVSRDYDDSSRRGAGTTERSRYPESFNERTNSVVLRGPHIQDQGPGRPSTLRRNSPSPPYNLRDDRRHSPPRYREYPSDSSRLPHYRGRAESPPQRLRGPDRLDRRDTPPDLPHRRPRGISDAHDLDSAPKRRKVDDGDETSTASTSPRSTGAMDDLSRQRRREPLPPQSHRYRDASELASRPPLSGSNRIIPPPQSSAQPPHRHYPPSSKDHDVFPPRHPDTDISRFDRSRNSGHDAGNVYVDKFSRDDHIKVDLLYPPRDPYEEPVHHQDSVNRSSSYKDAMSREPVPLTPHSREHVRRRSRDRSPRPHREPRQTGIQSSSVLLPAVTSGPPQAMQFIEDHRDRERRIDRDRGSHYPTPTGNSSNSVAPRSRSTGKYDVPEGGQTSLVRCGIA